ncbi:MAG: GNAT family N-acetyltransferase [Clostridia bacterium]|nr:GNAT family N-acetyltransferase [Clostridia bacterium]MBO4869137.1 GNAT family N-acetyltransferase [Clostridia bacterium]
MICKVDKGTELADKLLRYVENCSWTEVKDHIAGMIRSWDFSDWETMIVMIIDGKIVGMASVMKTDYYPLPGVCPWVSCIFVSEEYRGHEYSKDLIAYANRYLKENGFGKSYIPAGFFGLYERYGYTYLKDIVNYGGGSDHLFVKYF